VRIGDGIQPQIALGSNNEVILTWVHQNEIHFARSDDGGRLFSPSVKVAKPDTISAGMRRGPRIAGDNRRLVITTCIPDLQAWASSDGGKTWQGPNPVCDQKNASREGLQGLTSLSGGGFMVVWLDGREGRTEIWGSRSTDGIRWSPNQCIYRAPGGPVCECCHPSIISNGKFVYVMWRNALDGFRDLYLTSSKDGGEQFGTAIKLGTGTWKLAGCPMDGGAVAVSPQGQPIGVWRRDKTIFSAYDNKAETLIGNGTQPYGACGPAGLGVAWQQDGDIIWHYGDKANVRLGSGRYPVVAANPKANPIVAWENGNSIWVDASH